MVACASHHLSKAKVRTGQAVVRAAGGNRLKTLRALPYYPTAVDRPFCTSQSTLTVVLVQGMSGRLPAALNQAVPMRS
ncbi:unnamed protein product [Leptidea sinapis]|uniref:Uncharacterized protein n=1 Tax=Leptidea sinapis TaxID=189913 RepID=A0A5E4R536_9NEOP|nr:unnamed protein product [Leptidea sinapis]